METHLLLFLPVYLSSENETYTNLMLDKIKMHEKAVLPQ